MTNKQPFYHNAIILFTATKEFSWEDFNALIKEKLKSPFIVIGSVECEEIEAEPGDPGDLV
jgi:hypothetical protein